LSDWYLKKLGTGATVSVDGKAERQALSGRTAITIPPGVGRHRLAIRGGKQEGQ